MKAFFSSNTNRKWGGRLVAFLLVAAIGFAIPYFASGSVEMDEHQGQQDKIKLSAGEFSADDEPLAGDDNDAAPAESVDSSERPDEEPEPTDGEIIQGEEGAAEATGHENIEDSEESGQNIDGADTDLTDALGEDEELEPIEPTKGRKAGEPYTGFTMPQSYAAEGYELVEVYDVYELKIVLQNSIVNKPSAQSDDYPYVLSGTRPSGSKIYVHFTNNIALQNGFTNPEYPEMSSQDCRGINVHSNFTHVVLDAGGYQYDDMNENSTGHIIAASNSTLRYIEAKNMVCPSGGNYYGLFYVYGRTNATYVLDNVTYTGRQPIYCPGSTAIIRNSTINIVNIGALTGEEISESTHVILEGNVVLDSRAQTTTNEMFYLHLGSSQSVTVAAGANVQAYTSTSSSVSNHFIHAGAANYLFKVEKGASFSLVTNSGFGETHSCNSFIIEEDAAFYMNVLKQYRTLGHIWLSNTFYVGENASFVIESNGASSTIAALYWTSAGTFTLDNPNLFLVSGSSFSAITQGATTYNLRAQQLNYWTDFAGDYFSNPNGVRRHFISSDTASKEMEPFTITGTTSGNSANALNAFGMSEDQWDGTMTLAKYNEMQAWSSNGIKSVAFGRNYIAENPNGYKFPEGSYQGGSATPGSAVRLTYTDFNGGARVITSTASGNGSYSFALPADNREKIAPTSDAALASMRTGGFLFWEEQKILVSTGELELEVDHLSFGVNNKLAIKKSSIDRSDSDFGVRILDGRGSGNYTQWKLSVKMAAPFTSLTESTHTLEDVLKFYHNGTLYAFDTRDANTGDYVERLVGNGESDWIYETDITWDANTGFRLEVPTGAAYAEVYQGKIQWILSDTP